MNSVGRIAFVFYGFCVLGLALSINPNVLRGDMLRLDIGSDTIWPVVFFRTADWEQGQNPNMYRQNTSRDATFSVNKFPTHLKRNWSTEGINVGIHSASKSSAVADQNYIFVGSDSSWFYCFGHDGKINWKFYAGSSIQGIHSTAAMDSDNVYFGTYRGSLYSLQKKTGELNWTVTLGHTIGASPLIVDDEIVVAVETFDHNGYLVKLNRATGKIIWKSALLNEQAHSSPIYNSKNRSVVLGVNNSTIQSFDFKTGSLLWIAKVDGPVKSTMVLNDGFLYGSSWGKELFKLNASSGEKIWTTRLTESSQVSPVVLPKNRLVVTASKDGRIFGLNMDAGKIIWSIDMKFPKQISSPIVLSSPSTEKILFYCSQNQMCLISPKGKVEQKLKLDGYFTGSPVIYMNNMYLVFNDGPLVSYSF